jgi:hypothetical protein
MLQQCVGGFNLFGCLPVIVPLSSNVGLWAVRPVSSPRRHSIQCRAYLPLLIAIAAVRNVERQWADLAKS